MELVAFTYLWLMALGFQVALVFESGAFILSVPAITAFPKLGSILIPFW